MEGGLEDEGTGAETGGEVIQWLRILEQMANMSEAILQTVARKSLRVGATWLLERFAVALSSPLPEPLTLVQACFQLETQVDVLRSLELDAWGELREHALTQLDLD